MQPQMLDLPTNLHSLGELTYIHGNIDLPFDIRRVYYVYNIPALAERGGHAHRTNVELIVAVAGAFTVTLETCTGTATRFRLDSPARGLLVPPHYWRTLNEYVSGSVCLVLASEGYDPAEYVHDHNEFRALQNQI